MPFNLPVVKGQTPTEVWQLIKSENLFEVMDLEPKYVRHLWISNLITRTLARVLGQGPYGAVPIKCSQDGSLYVAGLGGGYSRNDTKAGNAPDAYGAAIELDQACGRIDVTIFDNPVIFKRTRDGQTWDDEIEMFRDAMYSIDVLTLQFAIKNKTAGAIARYQVVGWFGE